jgi:hypothetical protein
MVCSALATDDVRTDTEARWALTRGATIVALSTSVIYASVLIPTGARPGLPTTPLALATLASLVLAAIILVVFRFQRKPSSQSRLIGRARPLSTQGRTRLATVRAERRAERAAGEAPTVRV